MPGFKRRLAKGISLPNIRVMKLNEVQEAAREQFGRQSKLYGKGHILRDVSDVENAINTLALKVPADVLDVATGAGHTGLFLASLGHRVVLSDLAEPMLDQARLAARERGLKIETKVHPAEDFPFEAESFDLVTCRVAAHHFSSPERFVAEAARVLRKGGRFLLIDGTVEDGFPEAEEWAHLVEVLRDPSHQRFVSPNRWKEYCENHRLTVKSSTLTPFKQPDLNWYFDTASTSQENRAKVLHLIDRVPDSALRLFRVGQEDGKIVWWWQRLTLIAEKS
jgi:SAM-dependent methyltransferase